MIEDGLLDADLKPLDRLGRRELARFNVLTWVKRWPQLASHLQTRVPESYWAGNGAVCGVRCPCGAIRLADLGSLELCDCRRVYLYVGSQLRVGNSPTSEEVISTS